MSKIKAHHVLLTVIAVLGAAVAIERFYEHPTYGNGLEAALAAAKAAVALT